MLSQSDISYNAIKASAAKVGVWSDSARQQLNEAYLKRCNFIPPARTLRIYLNSSSKTFTWSPKDHVTLLIANVASCNTHVQKKCHDKENDNSKFPEEVGRIVIYTRRPSLCERAQIFDKHAISVLPLFCAFLTLVSLYFLWIVGLSTQQDIDNNGK